MVKTTVSLPSKFGSLMGVMVTVADGDPPGMVTEPPEGEVL